MTATKKFLKSIVTGLYRLAFRVEVVGIENYIPGAKILIPNHLSFHDPLMVGAFLPDLAQYMAKKELFKNKIVAKLLNYGGGFPVDRNTNDIRAVKQSLRILKNDNPLLIFAEGTRNRTDGPVKAKSGAISLALKAKVPIIPISIDSTYKLFHKSRIVFHKPVILEEYYGQKPTDEELEAIASNIMEDIYDVMVYHKAKDYKKIVQ